MTFKAKKNAKSQAEVAAVKLNILHNADCLPAMREMPDNAFDLAIVDPPYGGGATLESEECSSGTAWLNKGRSRFGGSRFDHYDIPANNTTGDIKHWDVAPTQEYFDELFRVSKNQIIWGGNYFDLPPTRCFVVWRKLTISPKFSMAMCEYAWTSFNANAFFIECAPQGNKNDPRFHPTQKPVKLYRELLGRFAKPGEKILDTHVGSGSSLVACIEHGFDYVGYEIDPGYFSKASARIDKVASQGRLAL